MEILFYLEIVIIPMAVNFLKGSVTIGVIVHSNCVLSGHGPGGVTGLLSCKTPKLREL